MRLGLSLAPRGADPPPVPDTGLPGLGPRPRIRPTCPGGRAAGLRLGVDRRGLGLGRPFTPFSRIAAARTSRIRLLGTAVVRSAARTPTATAMHAVTLDHLSGGRFMLGLGLSPPAIRSPCVPWSNSRSDAPPRRLRAGFRLPEPGKRRA